MFSEKLQGKSDDDACGDVDDECAIRESDSHSTRYERAHPEPEKRAESTSQSHQKIFLQLVVLLSGTSHAGLCGHLYLAPAPLMPSIGDREKFRRISLFGPTLSLW